MSRYRSTFNYKALITPIQDTDTGFWSTGEPTNWIAGGACHIEKHIPAKQVKGVDGVLTTYVYEIFIPKSGINLPLGTSLALYGEDGDQIDEVVVTGFDNTSRKHTVIWA